MMYRKNTALFFAALITMMLSHCDTRRALGISDPATDPKSGATHPNTTEAYLEVNEGPSHRFGNVDALDSDEVILTLYNSGVLAAEDIVVDTDLAAPFEFKGGTYPGTGGGCGTDLAAETTCDIVLVFSPTVEGTFSDTFVLAYTSDGDDKTFTFGVTGSSGEADITTDKDPTLTFDNTLVDEVTNVIVTLSNDGDLDASYLTDAGAMSAPFGYLGGEYPGTGGTCGILLDVGDTCTIVLSYAPTSAGSDLGAWGIGFISGGQAGAASLVLSGTAGTADLSISDGPVYDYGNRFVGLTLDKTFTITNNGSSEATGLSDNGVISGDFNYRGGSYPGTGGDCDVTLAAGASCTIRIRFTPSDAVTSTATLELAYHDGATDQTLSVDLTGVGDRAILEADIGSIYDFNRVAKNSTNSATVTISNNGNYAASTIADTGGLASPFRYKGFAYPGTGGTCTTTLAAGASCTIVLEYIPTGLGTGLLTHSDSLTLNYTKGSGSASMTLNVEGEAGLALVDVTGSSAWGDRLTGATYDEIFTVTNNGTYDATSIVEGAAFGAPFTWRITGSYPGSGGDCGAEIAPGGSCTIAVRFSPTLSQAYADTLELSYDDGETTQSSTLALSGTGVVAELSISAATHDFGTVSYNNNTATQAFTISNNGGYDATSVTLTGLAAPFSIQSTDCGATIVVGGSCTATIAFTPTAITSSSDTLNVDYDDGQAAQQETLDLDGEGINVVSVTSPSSETVLQDDPGTVFTLTATDENSDAMVYSIVSGPSNGVLGAVVGNSVTYTPNPSYSGADSFTFRVHDGSGFSNTSTVSITVSGLAVLSFAPASFDFGTASYNNEAPTQAFTLSNSGDEDATSVSLNGLAAPFSVQSTDCGATIVGGGSCTVTVAFTPTAITTSSDTLNVDYDDGQGAQQETLALDGEGINVVPVASDGAESVPMNHPGFVINLVATDENSDAMIYTIVSGPSNGSLGAVVGNSVTYTPTASYTGPDSFTFEVHDGSGFSNTATVLITVP
ncbi:choice-of-anchor D domain-containing protein [bacterium]|nr:choice-of-anchor D domain-containing protein [bacterium]